MITNEDEHLFIHLFMMCVDFYEIAAFSPIFPLSFHLKSQENGIQCDNKLLWLPVSSWLSPK